MKVIKRTVVKNQRLYSKDLPFSCPFRATTVAKRGHGVTNRGTRISWKKGAISYCVDRLQTGAKSGKSGSPKVRDQEAGGSNPLAPTNFSPQAVLCLSTAFSDYGYLPRRLGKGRSSGTPGTQVRPIYDHLDAMGLCWRSTESFPGSERPYVGVSVRLCACGSGPGCQFQVKVVANQTSRTRR
jgi:hypothetical protein